MSASDIEKTLAEPYNLNHWTVQNSIKWQKTVEDFLTLLRGGQLQKSKHQHLVDMFVNQVQEDPFWGIAQPIAPEIREGKVQASRMGKFPKTHTEDLYHVKEILDRIERIHRPLTEKELREQEEWKQELESAGVTVVGSPEWYEKIRRENEEGSINQDAGFHHDGPVLVRVGKPMMLGDILKAGKKGDGE
ncbi:MAG: hypothetical protein Q9209_001111 [Squamulea sp. 1 TL-2023]